MGVFISVGLLERLVLIRIRINALIYAEGNQNEMNQTVGAKHNEETDKPVDNLLFAIFPTFVSLSRKNELEDAEKQKQNRYRKRQNDQRIYDGAVDLV